MSKILATHPVRPHKIRYYLERRDPDFEAKMIEVLHVYKDVELWRKTGLPSEVVGVLCYDEKLGIQAIGNNGAGFASGARPKPNLGPSYRSWLESIC